MVFERDKTLLVQKLSDINPSQSLSLRVDFAAKLSIYCFGTLLFLSISSFPLAKCVLLGIEFVSLFISNHFLMKIGVSCESFAPILLCYVFIPVIVFFSNLLNESHTSFITEFLNMVARCGIFIYFILVMVIFPRASLDFIFETLGLVGASCCSVLAVCLLCYGRLVLKKV